MPEFMFHTLPTRSTSTMLQTLIMLMSLSLTLKDLRLEMVAPIGTTIPLALMLKWAIGTLFTPIHFVISLLLTSVITLALTETTHHSNARNFLLNSMN